MSERQPRETSAKKPEPALSSVSPELIKANLKDRAKAALAGEPLPRNHDREHTHGARAPPPLPDRLMSKSEVVTATSTSYVTIWAWMRAGKFPRSRVVGGRSMWLASEVNDWIGRLPTRVLKGDAPPCASS